MISKPAPTSKIKAATASSPHHGHAALVPLCRRRCPPSPRGALFQAFADPTARCSPGRQQAKPALRSTKEDAERETEHAHRHQSPAGEADCPASVPPAELVPQIASSTAKKPPTRLTRMLSVRVAASDASARRRARLGLQTRDRVPPRAPAAQVGKIRARDQQYQTDRCEQDQQRLA